MTRYRIILTLIFLAACTATVAYGDTISLSENWYVKITNYNSNFTQFQTYGWSNTSLIEPKLQDADPNNSGVFRTLLFDFHAGQVSTSDETWFEPLATTGSIWSGTMSFNWEIHCTNPRILLSVDTDRFVGGNYVWWSAPNGSNYRSGSASFNVSTLQDGFPPKFHITVAPVPEPSPLATMATALSGFGCLFCTKCRRVRDRKKAKAESHTGNEEVL